MKCINCGKKAVINNLCKDCFLEKNPLIINIKKIKIKKCIKCGSYFLNNKKINIGNYNEIKKRLKNFIVFNPEYSETDFEVSININNHKKEVFQFVIEAKGKKNNLLFNDFYEIDVNIEKFICDRCSRIESKYFTGILQLRNINNEILEYLERIIKEKNIIITKKKKVKNGIDLYFYDKHKILQISELLLKNFGGFVNKGAKLFSKDRQTSKEIYRLNVCYIAPKYKLHDIIISNDKVYKIIKLGKRIKVIDLSTGNKTSLANSEYHILKKEKVKVIKTYPKPEILTETFEIKEVFNKDVFKKYYTNKKDYIYVVEFNNKIYYVP